MLRAAAALTLLSLAFADPARAAMMHHHDLASLAFLSDAVIRVERRGAFDRVTRVRIVESYAGPLTVGADMDLPTSLYRLSGSLGGPEITPAETMIVFLSRRDGAWRITPSGLRVIDGDGHVQRFEQISNPGAYGLVPQGPDPADLLDGNLPNAPVDLPAFERMLRQALRRAEAMRAALAIGNEAQRRAAVLQVLPAPRSRLHEPQLGFYNDALADGAARALGEAGDVRGVLEVWSRMAGDRVASRSVLRREQDAVLAIAGDSNEPAYLRATALLGAFESGNLPTVDQARVVLAQLDDPSTEVRAAALAALDQAGRVQSSEADWPATQRRIRRLVGDALQRRYRSESEPAVRVQMLRSREVWQVRPRRVGRSALSAVRDGQLLRYAWARRENGPGPQIEVSSAGEPCATDPSRRTSSSMGTSGDGVVAPTACPLPWTVVARDGARELGRVTVD